FRQYSSSLGRWMHPDPAGLAAVNPSNPQSWNRYSYVSNGPLNFIDPSGLCDVVVGGFTQTPGSASTQTQQQFANEIGANQAYPFSGLNFFQSISDSYNQTISGSDAVRNAI